jgi:beta-glucosidase
VAIAIAFTGLSSVSALSAAAAGPDLAACPWLDTHKSADERADLLLAASTQQQKYRWLDEKSANSPAQTTFGTVTYPAQVACTPTVVYTDGPDGIRGTTGVTAFPAQISLASTWNEELSYDKGTAQAEEGFDKGKNGVLGPGVTSGRTPLAGRNPEYLGEDSLLGGSLAAEITNGLQGGNPDKTVLANIKHYVANEQETNRQTSSSNIDEQTLHQVYDLPYEVLESKSDPASVMCSYNQINGVYACENDLLTTNLKGDIGFNGFVMSDFGAVHSTAESLMAGLDQELNTPKFFTPALFDAALSAGTITQERLDEAAHRVVRSYIAAGLFDHALPATPAADVSTAAHKALSQEIAEQGSVLLKNQSGALPLVTTAGESIALIGATVSTTPTNGVSAITACSQSNRGRVSMTCENVVSPETAFAARAEQDGGTVTVNNGSDVTAAATAAADADVAIVFANVAQGEFADLTDLHLQNNGDALITAVAASAKKTIVVLETGSAVEMPWLNSVDSVVEAWYPGDQQGPALASLLWGDTNFSGKLPMTFPKSINDLPTQTVAQYPGVTPSGSTIAQVDYTEGLEVGYKWYDEQNIDPLFEFGYGLSYTSFDYSDLAVKTTTDSSGAVTSTASFTVTNTGDIAGAEIPQAYLTLPSSAGDPGKRLVGWDRVSLASGESTTVSIDIASSDSNHPFGIWDVDADKWVNVDGQYKVSVGSSSRDLPLTARQNVEFGGSAPTVTVTASPSSPTGSNGWYTAPVTLTPAATDDTDTTPSIEVNVDDAGWFAAPASIVVSTDGVHTVSVRATDDSGNVSSVATTTVKVDTTKPQVAASSDGAAHTVTLQATDATSGVARIEYAPASADLNNPASWLAYTAPIAAGRAATSYSYRAVDTAGNVSGTSRFDYVPTVSVPAVALSANTAKSVAGKTVTLTAKVPTDAVGKIEFFNGSKSLGASSVANGIASKAVKLDAGTYILTARFSGDTVYSNATSMYIALKVSKAAPSSVKVTTKTFAAGSKPTVKATVGKLSNGNWAVGKVTFYVNGKSVGSDTIKAADHGKSSLKLSKKYSSSLKVKAKFVPKDRDNVIVKTSATATVKAKKK